MPAQAYAVPVIFQDLRQEEALLQMFDSLQFLENTVNDVYDRISKRVANERGRISAVTNRLAGAKEKLAVMKGNTKTTTVFSPPKYPAPKRLEDFAPLYNTINPESRVVHPDYEMDQDAEGIRLARRQASQDFEFLVQMNSEEPQSDPQVGLGRLPKYVPSVSSLLLFNTSENPYKEFKLYDNTAGEDIQKQAEAEKSIAGGLTSMDFLGHDKEDEGFKPAHRPAPTIDFPSMLPGLDSAEMNWKLEDIAHELPDIHPSMVHNNLPALPPPASTVNAADMPDLPAVEAPPAPAQAQAAPPPAPTPPPPAPPPPPPPPTQAAQPTTSAPAETATAEATDTPPPPPPPPSKGKGGKKGPPPGGPSIATIDNSGRGDPAASAPTPTGVPDADAQPEGMGGLLAQIRGFSKDKLKKDSASDSKSKPTRASKKPAAAPSMMEQIKNAVGRRGAAMKVATPKEKDDDDEILMPGMKPKAAAAPASSPVQPGTMPPPPGAMMARKAQVSDSDSDWE